MGDNHSKDCAINVASYLSDNYMAQGLVKPGTCSDILTKTAMNVIKNLTKNHFLILWSGANNVAKNNTMKAFRCLVDLAKNSSHTNVILASVLHRHDLMSSSCVNEEIRALNQKLMKITKIFGHVSIMEVDPNREYYTKHGQHPYNLGKAKVSKQLFLQLLSVLQQKKAIPICLSWTKDHTNNVHDETQDQVEKPPSTTTTEQNNSAPRKSYRLKETPATMNEDFFLDNRLPKMSTCTSVIHSKGQTPNQFFKLFHQNIGGLRGKTSELLCYLHQDLPHLMCFSEHHLSQFEVDSINTENYSLGAKYCRRKLQKGGVSIFIQSHLQFTTLNLDKYCVDRDIEVCALQLDSTFLNICILVIYTSLAGNFNTFVTQLDKILQKLCTIKSNLIICGDVHVNYLQESNKKSQLNALLNSYNLFSIVQFPTRTYKKSISAINIFIDTTKIDTYVVIPVINGLSNHDAQIINLNTSYNNKKSHGYQTYFRRNVNKYTMAEFQNSLSYESWDQVFDGDDVNKIFSSFLNIYLRIFYASFPLKNNNETKTPWIMIGIKTFCIQKRKL